MAAVKDGGDRQELHEAIREHSMACKTEKDGAKNDLLERIKKDDKLKSVHIHWTNF